MAAYNKFDRRVDSLVIEARTSWGPDVLGLSAEEQAVVAKAIHEHPELASQINYERAHTGFTREITVTAADIARLYDSKVAAG